MKNSSGNMRNKLINLSTLTISQNKIMYHLLLNKISKWLSTSTSLVTYYKNTFFYIKKKLKWIKISRERSETEVC